MKLELLNTSYNASDVHFIIDHFDTLMENADVQMKMQLLESLIERINLNPNKTLKNTEFKFEVHNQRAIENPKKHYTHL